MSESVPMTQLEIADYDLGLRGKLVRAGKSRGRLAMCTIVYGLSLVDDVTDTPFSSAANGYPDAPLVPDESTRVAIPWRPGTDAVIADLVDDDGFPLALSPRVVLQSLAERYAQRDLEPVLGFEYEVWLFGGTHSAGEARRPFGGTENAYSLTRSAEVASLAAEFIDRMDAVGVTVEMFHAELGPGFFEFTLAPVAALRAADNAARARQYLRDLCAERGLHASFMAKPFADKSGAGGHVHSSLVRDGVNVFTDGADRLSDVAQQYLAGLLIGMPDTVALMNPYVNSFKRIDPEMFTPAVASWGLDDRSTSCRIILTDSTSARVEHRRPGADVSPYLAAAAVLAAGMHGLTEGLALPDLGLPVCELPPDLSSAVTLFEDSIWLTELLGKPFCTSYAATRRAEANRYDQWLRRTITSWELNRHLEHQ